MANESIAIGDDQMRGEISAALARLTHVQGVLFCAVSVLDEHVVGSPEWQISEALHGALALLDGCYTTLSDATATEEPAVGAVISGDEAELVRAWRACSDKNRAMLLAHMRELVMPKAA